MTTEKAWLNPITANNIPFKTALNSKSRSSKLAGTALLPGHPGQNKNHLLTNASYQ